ncbi:DNA-binding response OmpR family regulator [Scopulibacillus darangshiensis]|uniref:DNA-binding response OmpR family regulator n=1 Tax=Scopulibacillus darangshiensis TaxID=442528 RepID=A0A4R2PCG3_9BACL|nr:response regulator transcription factor [Scopulibacillus darangshiensis]TCP31771.1 DNA-binding response OmpR family regulator [Scopulibacillus darangshiensis]
MKKPFILLADDELRIRKLVSDFLIKAGFEVLCARDGKEALDIFTEQGNKIALIILDVMMPNMNGWEVLKEIKELSIVPVIMLTARGEEADQLKGFKLGANDYVNKPFSPSVLVARVENLLKRSGKIGSKQLVFGNISIEPESRIAFVENSPIELTPKEFDLLLYFFNNMGIALTRDKLLNAVWNYDYFGDLRTVDTHIKQLRAKLGIYSSYIQTVRGIGYRLKVQSETIDQN